MVSSTPDGFPVYTSNDLVALEAALNAQSSASQAVVDGRIQVYKVANTTERNSLVATLSPTVSNPLMVWRGNGDTGAKWEYTTNGTTWFTILTSQYTQTQDTGWVDATTGFTYVNNWTRDNLQYRARNGVFSLSGTVIHATGTGFGNPRTILYYPPQYRPTGGGNQLLQLAVNRRSGEPNEYRPVTIIVRPPNLQLDVLSASWLDTTNTTVGSFALSWLYV